MPKITMEELKGEARLLAGEYDKRIADLQKRKAEALKRYEEKTEKLRIKLMKQLVNDISNILDKKRYASPLDTYNLRYRSASSLAEEFGMSEEEKRQVFSDFYNATEQELIDAHIRVPKKTIYISNYDAKSYAQAEFSEEELKRYYEVESLIDSEEEIFERFVNKLMGDISISNIMQHLGEYIPEGGKYTDTADLLSDILIAYGFYVPGNASQLAKFCDDNGYTIDISSMKDMKPGDICFISRDEGTYKDVTDIFIKVEGGAVYRNGLTGEVVYSDRAAFETSTGRGTEVMYARLK